MINYELAKKLKDAGFPQKYGDNPPQEQIKEMENNGYAYIPTLSELIDACGYEFMNLHQARYEYGKRWGCRFQSKYGIEEQEDMYETPEEAVANLYLKLND
jgi:hypothetical protein